MAELAPELIGDFGGQVSAVEIGIDAVYVGAGARVRVLERGQQASLLGRSPILGGRVHDLVYEDDLLFVAAGKAGLLMLDVTRPDDIAPIGPVALPAAGQRYTELELLKDDHVVVSVETREGGGLVHVFERGEDGSLRLMAATALDGIAAGLDLLGDRLVVGMPGIGVVLFEIDRASGRLVELGRVEDGLGMATVLGDRFFFPDEIWLHEIDWSELSSPRFLGKIVHDMRSVASMESESGRVCLGGEGLGISVAVRCFALDGGGTLVPDVRFGLEEDRRRFWSASIDGPAPVALDGDVIYVAVGAEGLHRLEPGQTGAGPRLLSVFETRPQDLELQGDLAFTTSQWTGLEIWETSMSGEARRLWAQADLRSNELAVDGNRLYSRLATEIQVRDITDPATPTLLGAFDSLGASRDIVASDGLLFLLGYVGTEGQRLLRILDARLPNQVKELATLSLPGRVKGWNVRGKRLWYATGAHELVEVDLADPSRPNERARHVMDWADARIDLTEDRLVASTRDWVRVYDIGEPGSLRAIGDPIVVEPLMNVAADGHLLALTGLGEGVRILDTSGPNRVAEVARWAPEAGPAERFASDVSLDAGRLAVGFGPGTSKNVHTLDLAQPHQFVSEGLLAARWDAPTDLVTKAGKVYLATAWDGDWILDLHADDRTVIAAQLPNQPGDASQGSESVPSRRLQVGDAGMLVTSAFEIFELGSSPPARSRFVYEPLLDQEEGLIADLHSQVLLDDGLGFVFWQARNRNLHDSGFLGPGHLDIVEVSTSKPPRGIGRLLVGDLPRDLARQEGFLYVAGEKFLWIIDARDPQQPVIDHWVQGFYQALATAEGRLWALGRDRLDVYDLRRPDDPRPVAALPLPASVPGSYEGRFSISKHGLGTYGAVALGEDGLLVLDLGEEQPEIVGLWQPGWPVAEVDLNGRHATVAFEHGGLMTLDLSLDPGAPVSRIHLPLVSR